MLDISGFTEVLESSYWIWPAIAALIGLQIGSFINVLVGRLPQMMQREWEQQMVETQTTSAPPQVVFNLATPSSHCTSCHTPLRVRDLVPVLSFVWLKGRCAHCGAKVSLRYPLVEMAVALLWAYCAWRWQVSGTALAWALFATVALALALIDADTMLLPDSLTLPLMWAGMLCASIGWIHVSLEQSVWGAALGYGVLWWVQAVFGWITGKQGMGAGDFKLLAALGAWMGWMALPVLVLMASVSGVVVALVMRVIDRVQAGEPLPFGPHLVLAAGIWMVAMSGSLANIGVMSLQ